MSSNEDKNLIGNRIKILNIFFVVVIVGILFTLFFDKSLAALLDNDVKVNANSELTYYLNVSYDGADRNGIKSDDITVSEIKSGTLFVEDKIPNGLEFIGFVTTGDGSIGAVKRCDGSICLGKVIDDTKEDVVDTGVWNETRTEYTYHGLHYDVASRTVRFKVKNLKAGCKLTVGIKTKTPSTIDDPATPEREKRRDFYNFATAREKNLTINSNTVHAFMGDELTALHSVQYGFTGDVPEEAPNLPITASYAVGSSVGVASPVKVEGYTFSGWTTEDALVTDGSFRMPDKNVILSGSFARINTNKVTYKLNGTIPDGYVLPFEKNYYPGAVVNLDVLKEGDVFNGYRFLGWTTSDVTISDDRDFVMPSRDVLLVGQFEEVTYKVIYQFYDTVSPPNSENYLPETKTFRPGAIVTLENVVSEPSGYKFLGWYKESTFDMPENDVIVYGEWMVKAGTFEPTISKEVVGTKDYFRFNDEVKFKITVTNTASFPIKNVIVKENLENARFIGETGYNVLSERIASVDFIDVGGKVDLFVIYRVSKTDKGTIENVAEIKGALADNDYQLAEKEYKASTSFKIQSKLEICKVVDGFYNDNTFQFHITGNTNNYETWVTLKKDECETIYVDPSDYRIKEIVPQEYSIKSVTGAVTSDDSNLRISLGNDYKITYTNEFVKKGFFHSFGRIVNKVVQGGR